LSAKFSKKRAKKNRFFALKPLGEELPSGKSGQAQQPGTHQ
jgi:hypothetical protein